MSSEVATDDVVESWADAATHEREPLVVLDRLTAFLDEHDLGHGRPVLRPIGDGHSNVTYAVTRDGLDAVLRRPPRGPLPPSAHDVLREARVLAALHARARVPRVRAICADESVIGAPFYVMERVEGSVITTTVPGPLDEPAQRRRIGEELVDALIEIHRVDWRSAGLDGLSRPGGYLARQIRRFTGLWEHNRTRDVPAVTRVARWLEEHLPDSAETAVVHGDYRLPNVIFEPQAPAQLATVLDWEMAALGDPLADLGYLAAFWVDPADAGLRVLEGTAVTREPGFLRREELVDRYEWRAGRRVPDIRWYMTLALWKSVVFMEGNFRRALAGVTDDPFLHTLGDGVLELAARAEQTAFGSAGGQ